MKAIISFLKLCVSFVINTFFPDVVFGVAKGTAAAYVNGGLDILGTDYLWRALFILILLFILKFFGFLNIGNLPQKTEEKKNSSLNGKKILFLGSSVTKGFAAQGTSFVDYIGKETGAEVTKEAVSGTTLVNNGEKSYVARLKKLDKNTPYDLFVCQLSTNDATKKLPLEDVKKAITEIIDYVRDTWHCPVAFYTSPRYASTEYAAMVDALHDIAKEKDIQIIDLWNNEELNQKPLKKFTYMNDKIHPSKKGYKSWTPFMEQKLEEIISTGKVTPSRELPKVNTEELKKQKSSNILKTIGKWALVIVLALTCVTGASAYKTLTDTTGAGKPGNRAIYNLENVTAKENSPLAGKNILFIGSSVTYGFAAGGTSYVDYIGKLDSCNAIKEVYSGTTVATLDENSYVPRIKKYDHTTPIDAVVIQLSSNDSYFGNALGEISDSFDMSTFDDTTFAGGMETLIAYSRQEWDCPIVVYANPAFRGKSWYNGAGYEAMKDFTKDICEKWNVVYLNMWDDPACNALSNKQFFTYMSDTVHPTKQGYLEWWTPMFEDALYPFFE